MYSVFEYFEKRYIDKNVLLLLEKKMAIRYFSSTITVSCNMQ